MLDCWSILSSEQAESVMAQPMKALSKFVADCQKIKVRTHED